jgi:DNA-binding SARP family transcriptional activator/TolB-like protein/uncharacterized protein YukE
MGASVGASVEMPVDSERTSRSAQSALHLRLVGPLSISRDGVLVRLPASRKARALLAYLALAPQAATRTHLCELFWDVPNDPRGELRWCLSKIRSIVDEPGRRRVDATADSVRLDLSDCFVDATEVLRATRGGVATLELTKLRELLALFSGEFLEGLEIDRNPQFNSWLTSQRHRFRAAHTALLERLAKSASGDDVFGYVEKWLELAPFDRQAHALLLNELAARDRVREGDEHLAAAARLFEAEGLDHTPVRNAWRDAKLRVDGAPTLQTVAAGPSASTPPCDGAAPPPRRASIAVMPFVERTAGILIGGGPAGGFAHDLITRLAKLRSLFVIAQGTVFALSERSVGPEEAGRMLNVDYVVSGSLERRDGRLIVAVELAETRTARVIWADVFDQKTDDAFAVLDEIGNRVVASIAHEIETVERNRAILKPPSSLDAWEAYHRGLWHMYRFNKADNALAHQFFATASRLDPTFARAFAGLSFTHFQNAFQGWADRAQEIERAFELAGQSLMVDDRDPAAHWAMGRALWLQGRRDQSLIELEQTIELSPNFALGHYTLAFVHSQAGDPQAALKYSDHSRQLSPFDPLLFGMLGARAMALMRLGQFAEAAEWAIKAAARPNAHAHILAIAAYSLALAGRLDQARSYMTEIRRSLPAYGVDDFLIAMRFAPEHAAVFRDAAARLEGA